jgi:hypothetical protein
MISALVGDQCSASHGGLLDRRIGGWVGLRIGLDDVRPAVQPAISVPTALSRLQQIETI